MRYAHNKLNCVRNQVSPRTVARWRLVLLRKLNASNGERCLGLFGKLGRMAGMVKAIERGIRRKRSPKQRTNISAP